MAFINFDTAHRMLRKIIAEKQLTCKLTVVYYHDSTDFHILTESIEADMEALTLEGWKQSRHATLIDKGALCT